MGFAFKDRTGQFNDVDLKTVNLETTERKVSLL